MEKQNWARVRKATLLLSSLYLLILACHTTAVAQSREEGFGETLQRYSPELIEQLSCKPYDLDCQNRARMKYYQKMSEDNARRDERAAKEEQRQKEQSARERCSDRDDDRSWALCMKRYLGE